jgi:hypothetical protein
VPYDDCPNSDMLFDEQKSSTRAADDDLRVLGEKLGETAEKVKAKVQDFFSEMQYRYG